MELPVHSASTTGRHSPSDFHRQMQKAFNLVTTYFFSLGFRLLTLCEQIALPTRLNFLINFHQSVTDGESNQCIFQFISDFTVTEVVLVQVWYEFNRTSGHQFSFSFRLGKKTLKIQTGFCLVSLVHICVDFQEANRIIRVE